MEILSNNFVKNNNISDILHQNSLFTDVDSDVIKALISKKDITYEKFKTGEVIYDSNISCDKIKPGIIASGRATVYSSDRDRDVCLRILTNGCIFGIAALFTDSSEYISTIKSDKECAVVFIKPNAFKKLIETNKAFMTNYMKYLNERIIFLNKKIRQFTAGSAERKLAIYLDTLTEDNKILLPFSYSKLAEMLDIGRASLYRSLDYLSEKNIITREGKEITIIDRKKLQKINYD